MGKRGRTLLFSAFVLLGLAVVNIIVQVGVEPGYQNMSTDSGTFAYCGQVVREGGLLYRDCWDNKPPGIYYLNALAISLAGPNPFAVWLLQAIWLIISMAFFYLLLSRVWENYLLAALGSFTALLVVLYPGIFQGGNYTETYAILPGLVTLAAFWAYLRSGRRRWLVVLGLSTAAGFLLKPTYIGEGLAATLVLVYLGIRQRKLRPLAAQLASIAAAVLLPLLLVAMYWAWKQDLFELWFAVFAHNISYVQQGFSLSSMYGTARLFFVQQPMASLTILFLISMLAFIIQHRRQLVGGANPAPEHVGGFAPIPMDAEPARMWLVAVVFTATLLDILFLASSGKNFGHYLQVVVPGMVFGALCLLNELLHWEGSRAAGRNLQLFAFSAVIIISLGAGLEIGAKEMPSLQPLKTFISNPNPTIYQPNELEQYIIDHSSAQDTVLVWAGHPGMNFVTQRRSPTRYIFLLHLFTPTPRAPNGFAEFLHDLETNPPKLIVVQPVSSMGLPDITGASAPTCPGCDPSVLEGLARVHQLVSSHYQLSFSIWDWVVYARLP